MLQPKTESSTFIDQMAAILHQHHLQKLQRHQNSGEQHIRERQAKNTLMQLGNACEESQLSDDDIFIGRWSHYRIPDKNEERLSLNHKSKKFGADQRQFFRYNPERTGMQTHCRSERTIPKLKIILHQLEQPLHLPPQNKTIADTPRKMRNHIGRQALVISNKQEIRPCKSDRKTTSTLQGGENKRPQANLDNLTTRTSAGNYQKIKRQIGLQQPEKDLQYQKDLLSQLIKGKCGQVPAPQNTPLSLMLQYFTQGEKKRKATARLGLDRLLS